MSTKKSRPLVSTRLSSASSSTYSERQESSITSKKTLGYDNEFYLFNYAHLSSTQHDLLIVLLSQIQSQNTPVIVLSFAEIRTLTKTAYRTNRDLYTVIIEMSQKIFQGVVVSSSYLEENVHREVHLFSEFIADLKKQQLRVVFNQDYLYLFNDLGEDKKPYTLIAIDEFLALEGKYSKLMYRLLKRWRTIGVCTMNSSQLRQWFGIPSSYNDSKILQRILSPSLKELEPLFVGLNMDFVKDGTQIVRYVFKFQKQGNQFDPEFSLNASYISKIEWELQQVHSSLFLPKEREDIDELVREHGITYLRSGYQLYTTTLLNNPTPTPFLPFLKQYLAFLKS